MVTGTSDKLSLARSSKPGLVTKRRKSTSSLRSVDESVDEGIPEKEPRFDDEEADAQRALEESLKSVYDAPWGFLPPMVIREPESGKYQPLPEVQEKGKEKVNNEVESDEDVPGIDAGVQDEGQAGPNPGEQDEGQARPNPGDAAASQPQSSHVVHVGPNLEHIDLEAMNVSTQLHPKQMDEGFTATVYLNVQDNLELTIEEHVILEEPASSTGTLSSLQHLAKDLSFGALFFNVKSSEANNEKTTVKTEAKSMLSVTIQQDTSLIPPMTTLIIDLTSRPDSPNVHRPLQATATETTTITTTTTHPPPPQPQQSTTDSMLMKHICKLKQIMGNLIQDNKYLEERLDSHGAHLYTLENLDIPQQVSKEVDEIVTNAVDLAVQAPLHNRFRDLPEADMKEILYQRIWETNTYKAHEDYMMLYEALEKSMNRDHTDELLKDLTKVRKKKKKRHDSPKMPPHQPPPPPPPAGLSGTSRSPRASGSSQVPQPPPPPPSTNKEGQSHGSTAPSSSKTAASAEYKAWTMTDTRIRPSVSSTLEYLHMDDDMSPDAQVHSSDDEDIENAHIPNVNLQQDWWKPLEEDRPATPEPAWSIPSSDLPVQKNNWAYALASTYSCRMDQNTPFWRLKNTKKKTKSDQNRTKREAWRSQEKSEAVTVIVERETEVTKDTVPPTNNGSTEDVQPPVVQIETSIPNSEPIVAPDIEPVVAPLLRTVKLMVALIPSMIVQPPLATPRTNMLREPIKFMKMNTASSLGSGTLPGNTISNPKEELKGITTRSGTAYQGPTIPTTSSSLPPVVERETEATKDTVHPTNNGSTKDVQPSVVQTESLILNSKPVVAPITKPVVALVSAPKPNQRPSIPYPSRLHDQKLRDK
nr:reverse transcriptase domain-containing protein [Tanacetum cinerariifolium]